MTLSYCRSAQQQYQELKNMKYGNYSPEMLGILEDLARQNEVSLEFYIKEGIKVPNGTCHRCECERRDNIIKEFEE